MRNITSTYTRQSGEVGKPPAWSLHGKFPHPLPEKRDTFYCIPDHLKAELITAHSLWYFRWQQPPLLFHRFLYYVLSIDRGVSFDYEEERNKKSLPSTLEAGFPALLIIVAFSILVKAALKLKEKSAHLKLLFLAFLQLVFTEWKSG